MDLVRVKNSDPRLRANMAVHYSSPKGFVGRNICYAIMHGGAYYGGIVAGSSTLHLVGRDEFFGIAPETKRATLRTIINNIFYHVEPVIGRYPLRNFTITALRLFRERAAVDWFEKYGDPVIGFESLIEPPRTGEIYRRDGWTEVGLTKGETCKRVAGKGTDSWGGKRVWNTEQLRPKLVFCRRLGPEVHRLIPSAGLLKTRLGANVPLQPWSSTTCSEENSRWHGGRPYPPAVRGDNVF